MSSPLPSVEVQLPPAPTEDGNLVELSFRTLADNLTWLFQSVDILSKGFQQVNAHLKSFEDLRDRLNTLENKPEQAAPEPQVIREAAPPQVKVEIPYIPSNEDIAAVATGVAKPLVESKVDELLEKIAANSAWIKAVEELAREKPPDPWARIQSYFQEIGFLPYGEEEESDPLVNMGNTLVLLRQDIAMCPKIKDLEDAEAALRARIAEVEALAAADREARANAAAAESAKIREDLEKVEKLVQALIRKNLEDGDVAGALRDLCIRVDKIEDLLANMENQRQEEEAEVKPAERTQTRPKGFLESLAEVDIPEELRRLRSMVECMEAAMPYETRQTLEYLRSGKAGQLSHTGEGRGLGTEAGTIPRAKSDNTAVKGARTQSADLRMETEDQLQRFRQSQTRELQSVMKVLKTHERTMEGMDAKILDLWQRLPKVLALLEPLQVQMEMTMNNEFPPDSVMDSTGGPGRHVAPFQEGGTGGGPDTAATAGEPTVAGARGAADGAVGTGVGASLPSLPPLDMSKGSGPAFQPAVASKSRDLKVGFKDGFNSSEGTAGTGEGGGPLKELGSLTGLIKLALQKTTDDIHADLRQELLRLRAEMNNRLDLKADKTELAALLSRFDVLVKKDKNRERFQDIIRGRDRSPSPTSDQAANGDMRYTAPSPGKPFPSSAASPNVAERKKGHSCHENCKVPTCPRALQMTQSLSRLPALKVVQ